MIATTIIIRTCMGIENSTSITVLSNRTYCGHWCVSSLSLSHCGSEHFNLRPFARSLALVLLALHRGHRATAVLAASALRRLCSRRRVESRVVLEDLAASSTDS